MSNDLIHPDLIRPCFDCAAPARHKHHVIPPLLGGTRTVWLCPACHQKATVCLTLLEKFIASAAGDDSPPPRSNGDLRRMALFEEIGKGTGLDPEAVATLVGTDKADD